MAEKATIARPYAKAAFEHARAGGEFARWSKILGAAAAVVKDQSVRKLLGNPRVKSADLVSLIADVCDDSFDENGRNFMLTLANNRRLALLPEIASMYETLRADAENVADVDVVSAIALDAERTERLSAALKKRLKRDVRLHCSVDESLLGGAIVRSGDFVIDGSLKARLDRLASEMTH
jgi:F-type H+-transporting ATPase subunit delta